MSVAETSSSNSGVALAVFVIVPVVDEAIVPLTV